MGVLVGLAVALVARWLLNKLPAHPSERVRVGDAVRRLCRIGCAHGSGVVAVVTLALSLSRYSDQESAQTRIVAMAMSEIVELLVTGAAFAFVGLELRAIALDIDEPVADCLRRRRSSPR